MAVSSKNVRLAYTVDQPTANKIKKLAEDEIRTVSAMSSILIKEALQNRENKKQSDPS